jgi:hypothetical protein
LTSGADGYVNKEDFVDLENLYPIPPSIWYITGVKGSPTKNTTILNPAKGNNMSGKSEDF